MQIKAQTLSERINTRLHLSKSYISEPCFCVLRLTAEDSEEPSADGALAVVLGYDCEVLARHFIPFRRLRKRREPLCPALNPVIFLSPGRSAGQSGSYPVSFHSSFCLFTQKERERERESVCWQERRETRKEKEENRNKNPRTKRKATRHLTPPSKKL